MNDDVSGVYEKGESIIRSHNSHLVEREAIIKKLKNPDVTEGKKIKLRRRLNKLNHTIIPRLEKRARSCTLM